MSTASTALIVISNLLLATVNLAIYIIWGKWWNLAVIPISVFAAFYVLFSHLRAK